jgi:hypothetical protein
MSFRKPTVAARIAVSILAAPASGQGDQGGDGSRHTDNVGMGCCLAGAR